MNVLFVDAFGFQKWFDITRKNVSKVLGVYFRACAL